MIEVSVHRLTEFAWSAPLRDLAPKLGLSDVGLRKILKGHGINLPPQGYWLTKGATKRAIEAEKIPPRGPGQTGRIHLDGRFETVLAPDLPVDPEGPFASAIVPEDLENLRATEIKALGDIKMPRDLKNSHPGLSIVFKKEETRRVKAASGQYGWLNTGPFFDNPIDQRQLRLLNALFVAVTQRGARPKADFYQFKFNSTIMVGDTQVCLTIIPAIQPGGLSRYNYAETKGKLPPRSRIVVTIGSNFSEPYREVWQDDADGQLEGKISKMAAAIIVAGEAAYRRQVRANAEWRARQQHAAETERQRVALQEEADRKRRIKEDEAKRIDALRHSGQLLREANDIRELIARVRAAVALAPNLAAQCDLVEWESWAIGYADRIDPIKSRQVLTHLRPLENK